MRRVIEHQHWTDVPWFVLTKSSNPCAPVFIADWQISENKPWLKWHKKLTLRNLFLSFSVFLCNTILIRIQKQKPNLHFPFQLKSRIVCLFWLCLEKFEYHSKFCQGYGSCLSMDFAIVWLVTMHWSVKIKTGFFNFYICCISCTHTWQMKWKFDWLWLHIVTPQPISSKNYTIFCLREP